MSDPLDDALDELAVGVDPLDAALDSIDATQRGPVVPVRGRRPAPVSLEAGESGAIDYDGYQKSVKTKANEHPPAPSPPRSELDITSLDIPVVPQLMAEPIGQFEADNPVISAALRLPFNMASIDVGDTMMLGNTLVEGAANAVGIGEPGIQSYEPMEDSWNPVANLAGTFAAVPNTVSNVGDLVGVETPMSDSAADWMQSTFGAGAGYRSGGRLGQQLVGAGAGMAGRGIGTFGTNLTQNAAMGGVAGAVSGTARAGLSGAAGGVGAAAADYIPQESDQETSDRLMEAGQLGALADTGFTGASAAIAPAQRAIGNLARPFQDLRVDTANATAQRTAQQSVQAREAGRAGAREVLEQQLPGAELNAAGTAAIATDAPTPIPSPARPAPRPPQPGVLPARPQPPEDPGASQEWSDLARRHIEPSDINRDIASDPVVLERAARVAREYLPNEFASSEAVNRAATRMRNDGMVTIDAMDDLVQAATGTTGLNMMKALAVVDGEMARIQAMPPAQQTLQARSYQQLERFSDALASGELPFSQAREIRNAARASGQHGVYAAINESIAESLPPDLAGEFLDANMRIRVSSNIRQPAAIGEQSTFARRQQEFDHAMSNFEAAEKRIKLKFLQSEQTYQDKMAYRSEMERVQTARQEARVAHLQAQLDVARVNDQAGEASVQASSNMRQQQAISNDAEAVSQIGLTQMGRRGFDRVNISMADRVGRFLNNRAAASRMPVRIRGPLEQAAQRGTLPAVIWGMQDDEEFRGFMDSLEGE